LFRFVTLNDALVHSTQNRRNARLLTAGCRNFSEGRRFEPNPLWYDTRRQGFTLVMWKVTTLLHG